MLLMSCHTDHMILKVPPWVCEWWSLGLHAGTSQELLQAMFLRLPMTSVSGAGFILFQDQLVNKWVSKQSIYTADTEYEHEYSSNHI